MEFINIYFAKHPEDATGKPYMFQAPLSKDVHKGVSYAVKTKMGVKKVIAVTNNMVIPQNYANDLKTVVGAEKLAQTLGEVVATIDEWSND